MYKEYKLLFYVGTEAELIKLKPIFCRLNKKQIEYKILCNGQNYLYSSAVFDTETFSKSIFLTSGNIIFPSNNFLFRVIWMGTWIINAILASFIFIYRLKSANNNFSIIVHGDTISTFIGTIVSILCRVKCIHVESGLTSKNLFSPFPEEICRRFVTKYSTVRFAPSIEAYEYAKKINPRKVVINTFANTMYDAFKDLDFNTSRIEEKNYFILIIHRQESLLSDKFVSKIIDICLDFASENFKCLFILHKQTKDFLYDKKLTSKLINNNSICLFDRLPFSKFIELFYNSNFILTDGGTNQEESAYMGKPCFLLRNTTERVEGLNENVVLPNDIFNELPLFMKNYDIYKRYPLSYKNSPSDIVVEYLLNC